MIDDRAASADQCDYPQVKLWTSQTPYLHGVLLDTDSLVVSLTGSRVFLSDSCATRHRAGNCPRAVPAAGGHGFKEFPLVSVPP